MLATLAAMVGSACGTTEHVAPGAAEAYPPLTAPVPAASAADVEGRTFLLESAWDADRPRPLVNDRPVPLVFRDGKMGLDSGCNVGGTSYALHDGELMPGGMTVTAMGCGDGWHAQDEWLLDFFAGSVELEVIGETIVLRSGAAAMHGRGLRASDLDGRTFLLTEVQVGGAPRPLVNGQPIELTFAHGHLHTLGTCNAYGWGYALSAGRIVRTSAEAASTTIGCQGPHEAQDAWLQRFLHARPAVLLSGHRLELRAGDTLVRGSEAAP